MGLIAVAVLPLLIVADSLRRTSAEFRRRKHNLTAIDRTTATTSFGDMRLSSTADENSRSAAGDGNKVTTSAVQSEIVAQTDLRSLDDVGLTDTNGGDVIGGARAPSGEQTPPSGERTSPYKHASPYKYVSRQYVGGSVYQADVHGRWHYGGPAEYRGFAGVHSYDEIVSGGEKNGTTVWGQPTQFGGFVQTAATDFNSNKIANHSNSNDAHLTFFDDTI